MSAPTGLKEGKNRVAVILAGCGVYDGSEIHETTFALSRLSRWGAVVHCFAPDQPQMHVVNHMTGAPAEGQTRNCLEESARLSRGVNTFALTALLGKAGDFDALVIPGGFGAAKNLSDFGPVGGPTFKVLADVQTVMQEFHAAGKVIGLSCMAPILAAGALGPKCKDAGKPLRLTLGGETEGSRWPYAGATGAAKALGCEHVEADVAGAGARLVVDDNHKVVSAPAYMCGEAKIHEVEESCFTMIDKTCRMIGP